MKSLLKRLLPWHLRQTAGWARSFYAKRKPPFRGIYARFDEVPSGAGWRADLWTEESRDQAEKWKRQIGAALPESSQPSRALLPMLVSAFYAPGRPVRILDFGGAGGVDYAQMTAALGKDADIDVRYHVVDMPGSCEAGRAVWQGTPRITFSSSLPEAQERFDIVYAFTALHTAEDFRGLLSRFAAYRPAFMLFCKTSMHDGPSFVRRQVNMGAAMENAQWALGLDDVKKVLEPAGYTLTYRGYGEDVYNVDNYPVSHRVGRTTNLLFRRNGDA